MSSKKVSLDTSAVTSNYSPTESEKRLKEYLQSVLDSEIAKYKQFGCENATGVIPKNMSIVRQADGTLYNKVELPLLADFEKIRQFFVSQPQEVPTSIVSNQSHLVFVLFELGSDYFVFPFIFVMNKKNKNQLRFWELCNTHLTSVKFDVDRLK